MSDRRKLTLPAKPDAPADQPAARRKPLRPNAPVQRQRARPAAGPEEQVTPPQEPSHTGGPERPEPRAAAPHQRPAQPQRPAKPQRPVQPPRAAQPRSQALPQHRARPAPASPTQHKLAPPVPSAARQAPEDGRVRLSKLMSEQGLASRREADDWIVQGWVRVDGEVVSELGTRVWPHQAITIDPEARAQQAQRVTILLHKPIGYVSGQAEDGYEPAVTLIRPENRWEGDTAPWQLTRGHLHKLAPAGRLDIDSTGLLVLTQDGRIARHLIGEDALVEKEYLVRVQSLAQPEAENVSAVVPEEALERLRHGLVLDDKPLKPAKVSWQNEQQLRFVLREGKKRQIRRMCEQVGLKVVGLKRVRMGQVVLGKLPVGKWRFLRPDERF